MAQTTDPRAVGKVRETLLARWNTMSLEHQQLDGISVGEFLRAHSALLRDRRTFFDAQDEMEEKGEITVEGLVKHSDENLIRFTHLTPE
jgi:hypothetical protein